MTTAARNRPLDVLQRLTPTQRILAGAGVITIIVGLLLVRGFGANRLDGVLYSDLDAGSAAEVVEQLQARGVSYELVDGGRTIIVDRNAVYGLRVDMAGQGLPSGNDGYAILDRQGLTASEFRQRIDLQRALEGELSRTIGSIDSIRTAVVHLALPEDSVFVNTPTRASASILVKTAGNRPLSADVVRGIRYLVASSVKDLDAGDVVVTDGSGRVVSDDTGAGGDRFDMEMRLQGDIADLVGRVVGPDRVAVTVRIDMNLDEIETTSERYQPPERAQDGKDGLLVSEQDAVEAYQGVNTSGDGVLGPDGAPVVGVETGGEVDYTSDSGTRAWVVDRTVETKKVAPGTVEKVSVAVVLDEEVTTEEQAQAVAEVVGAAAGVDLARGDTVVVSRLPFDTTVETELEEAEQEAAAAAGRDALFGLIRTLVVAVLGAVALLLAYRSVRRMRRVVRDEIDVSTVPVAAPPPPAPVEPPVPQSDPGVAALEMAERQAGEWAEENPENVAQVLRTWLADPRS